LFSEGAIDNRVWKIMGRENQGVQFGKFGNENQVLIPNFQSAIDVSLSFALLFAVKDEKEITYMKRSAEATVNAWNFLRKKFVDIVDTEKVHFKLEFL
jgi:nucleosome binding factor SPN SPT16 subunit